MFIFENLVQYISFNILSFMQCIIYIISHPQILPDSPPLIYTPDFMFSFSCKKEGVQFLLAHYSCL